MQPSDSSTEAVIAKFYTSFQVKDWKAMQACYHDDATFNDPVFQTLSSPEVKAMWHMLALAGKDLALSFNNIQASGSTGSCHWEAIYNFSRTGRKVHNIIEASFEFKDGKIIRHRDYFDLWRWAGMALGFPGKLLGWSPLMQNKIRGNAKKNLSRFVQDHPEYQ